MVVVWSYPWSLLFDDLDATCRDLANRGVTGLNVAAHYHSIRTLEPRSNGGLFESYEGGCYFAPDPEVFSDTPIDPPVNDIPGYEDPFETIVDGAARHGLDVNAWFVCFHNSKLGADNPRYRVQSAFGDTHDHAFCPSHSEVQRYFADVARTLADYDIGTINLESLGYPDAFHSHGATFGHAKNHVVRGRPEELLVSQCFCSACRRLATDHAVDFDRAREVVQRIARNTLQQPCQHVMSLDELAAEFPVLENLFDFRASVIDSLLGRLAAASGDVELVYSASDGLGRDPDDGWPAGVVLDRVQTHLDRIVALCYTADRDVARRRVQRYQETVDIPVDVGVTLDPDVLETESEWLTLLADVRDVGDEIHVYNHPLMSDAHLDWLDAAQTSLERKPQ
jgi:hypothetical protein